MKYRIALESSGNNQYLGVSWENIQRIRLGEEPSMVLRDVDGPDEPGKGKDGTIRVGAPTRLDTVLGWSFWRFDFTRMLSERQRAVQYVVTTEKGASSSATFWLQAKGQPFHWGYTSCNGISGSIAQDHYSREDPTYLWRDMFRCMMRFIACIGWRRGSGIL
eukprot:jgi/Picre1/32959/NNA_008286.t1